jgi:dTDP-4-dehydrorhamnose reductase
MTRILLTGKDGQVGRESLPLLSALGELLAVGHGDCELADADAIARTVRTFRPDVIVNAAGYTNVNQAESDQDRAYAINGTAPGILASLARESDAVLIHYSTDYVFDGTKREPWVESDATGPLNVYGASKLRGEDAIVAVGGRYLILRTSWVYGAHGTNFLRTICKLARERDELKIVDDQVGAPTSSRQIASATAKILKWLFDSRENFPSGIYHLTASGSTSWFGFAQAIVAISARSEELKLKRLLPVPSSDYPTPAKRPLNSVLSNNKLQETFGFRLGDWQHELEELLAECAQP